VYQQQLSILIMAVKKEPKAEIENWASKFDGYFHGKSTLQKCISSRNNSKNRNKPNLDVTWRYMLWY
jgi:hypothetical protein